MPHHTFPVILPTFAYINSGDVLCTRFVLVISLMKIDATFGVYWQYELYKENMILPQDIIYFCIWKDT